MAKAVSRQLFIFLLISLFSMVSCSSKNSSSSSQGTVSGADGVGKIKVYTTFYTLYDFTQKIGGDKITLTNLVPSGTEPHDWEPKPRDIAGIEKADVLIYNGSGMEGWIDKILKSVKNSKLIAAETSREIKLIEAKDDGEDHNGKDKKDQQGELKYDPHVWLNPMLAKKQMETIKEALVKADPVNKPYYESNFIDNSKKLDLLDKEYRDSLSKYSKRDIFVSHQAFGYLCEAYGLKQVAIEGLMADSEPTPAKMAEIATIAKEKKARIIFFEELVSPKVAQAIAREVGAKTEMLNPLEGLKNEDIKKGKDYFSVMRENLEALKKALE